MEKINWTKWIAVGAGAVLGVSHIGMIGLLATRQESKFPTLPTGDYTSYQIQSGAEGYTINYRANDPLRLTTIKDIKKKGGFLGLANNTTKVREEYVMDGAKHQGGPVSNHRSWQDPSTMRESSSGGNLSDKTVECIEAIGGGKNTGRLVGTSVGTAAAPALSGIPFVGWVAAGWVAMFGGNQGADIGGNMAEEMSRDC